MVTTRVLAVGTEGNRWVTETLEAGADGIQALGRGTEEGPWEGTGSAGDAQSEGPSTAVCRATGPAS